METNKMIMKKGFTSLHFRSTGRHTRNFIMTIAAAYLLAGMLVISFVIGKNFFNW